MEGKQIHAYTGALLAYTSQISPSDIITAAQEALHVVHVVYVCSVNKQTMTHTQCSHVERQNTYPR